MNRLFIIIGVVATLALFIVPVLLSARSTPPASADVITQTGLHWHPHLTIFIKGKKVDIPRNVGRTGPTEQPIHTHDEDDLVHLEFPGVVYESDTALGQFFKTWGKTLTHDCLFEFCNGPDGKLSMTVNNQPNTEYENYPLQGGDEIVLKYE